MNEKARTLAEGFARFSGDPDTLHVYLDGVVVLLDTDDADRHLTYRQQLRKFFPDFEEARYGETSVFVAPFEIGPTTDVYQLHPWLVAPTTGYHDHRWQDCNTLEAAIDLFSATIQAIDDA